MKRIDYRDSFISRLCDDIGGLLGGDASLSERVSLALKELASRNNPAVSRYWARTGGMGIPDTAFREDAPFHFDAGAVARSFRTSGTSGKARGTAAYSERGLSLLRSSIIANAQRHIFQGMDRPAVLRLLPDVSAAPDNIMAFGMALLSEVFGDTKASACAVSSSGIDYSAMERCLDSAVAEGRPVVLIGGSFAFVHACDGALSRGKSWQLPSGSKMVDAGGFKGRSRELDVDNLRDMVGERFGISRSHCTNIFGMTELASQLYDAGDEGAGPRGERPKGNETFIRARVRHPFQPGNLSAGLGLLEVEDLCVLDRPSVVLTGDWGLATPEGVAITGRVVASDSRGCALSFETPAGAAHV
jgi:hypothetical protein